MGNEPPPLPGAQVPTTDRSAALVTPGPAPSARPASGAAAVLTAIVAFAALGGFCSIGCGAFVLRAVVSSRAESLSEELSGMRRRVERKDAAEALLDEIAQHLEGERAVRRSYPNALPEAPPNDPWGTPIAYEWSGPDRAWLSSAGPDRQLGTEDDLVRALTGR